MFYRCQNKSALQAMLTEEYKLKRHKQTKVSIQMTVISWSLEFLTGVLSMTAMYLSRNEETNVDVIAVIVIVDTSLNFILIPSTYVFNNEMNKTFIMAEGGRSSQDVSDQTEFSLPRPKMTTRLRKMQINYIFIHMHIQL